MNVLPINDIYIHGKVKLSSLLLAACDFKCEADDKCITRKGVCDGIAHCSDGEDEADCGRLPVGLLVYYSVNFAAIDVCVLIKQLIFLLNLNFLNLAKH